MLEVEKSLDDGQRERLRDSDHRGKKKYGCDAAEHGHACRFLFTLAMLFSRYFFEMQVMVLYEEPATILNYVYGK